MRAIGVRENHAGDNDLNQGTARKKNNEEHEKSQKEREGKGKNK